MSSIHIHVSTPSHIPLRVSIISLDLNDLHLDNEVASDFPPSSLVNDVLKFPFSLKNEVLSPSPEVPTPWIDPWNWSRGEKEQVDLEGYPVRLSFGFPFLSVTISVTSDGEPVFLHTSSHNPLTQTSLFTVDTLITRYSFFPRSIILLVYSYLYLPPVYFC